MPNRTLRQTPLSRNCRNQRYQLLGNQTVRTQKLVKWRITTVETRLTDSGPKRPLTAENTVPVLAARSEFAKRLREKKWEANTRKNASSKSGPLASNSKQTKPEIKRAAAITKFARRRGCATRSHLSHAEQRKGNSMSTSLAWRSVPQSGHFDDCARLMAHSPFLRYQQDSVLKTGDYTNYGLMSVGNTKPFIVSSLFSKCA